MQSRGKGDAGKCKQNSMLHDYSLSSGNVGPSLDLASQSQDQVPDGPALTCRDFLRDLTPSGMGVDTQW